MQEWCDKSTKGSLGSTISAVVFTGRNCQKKSYLTGWCLFHRTFIIKAAESRRKILNLALLLTLGRIFLSPVFLVVYLYHAKMGITLLGLPFALIALVGIAELTDLFDGMAARRRNQVTELGKLLDPVADSIFRLSVFLALTQGPVCLPLWLVLCFFYRDSVISLLRTVCALRGFTLAARFSGKVKAVVQGVVALTIITLLIPYAMGSIKLAMLQEISFWLVLGAVGYSLFSGVEYLRANQIYIKKALAK